MRPRPSHPPMLYPNEYVWLIFVSALDIMLTWIVLWSGGREVNRLANAVVHRFGLPGLVAFKFALVGFVVVLCEWTGRRNPIAGRRLARISIAITCLPLGLAFLLLYRR